MPAPRLLTLPRIITRCSGFTAFALFLVSLGPACSDLTAPPSATSGGAAPPAGMPAPTTRAASPKAPAPQPPPDTPAPVAADTGESVAASHVLVAFAGATRVDPSIKRTKEEAQKLATKLLARARKGEDFGKLAEDNSDDPSAKRNKGSLGRFTRQQMVKPFSDAAFALKPGQVSELVETSFGYHVIKRNGVSREAAPVTSTPEAPAAAGAAASKEDPAASATSAEGSPPPAVAAVVPAPRVGPYPLPARVAYALATLTGLLYFLAFPGIDIWPLGFVALVPLIIAMRGQTPKRAAGLGWMAGFTMTMVGFYWLLEMLKTFSGFPMPVCFLFMCILCGYQGGRIAVLGWVYGRATARGWNGGLAFCLGFIASELTYPLLFPWYYGATVYQIPLLTQTAELGNPITVGLVLVAANFAVAEFIDARMTGKKPRMRLVGALAGVVLAAAAYGFVRIRMVDAQVAAAEKATVGTVQANMSLMGKRKDKQEGLRRHLALTESLTSQGPMDLVVWSETSVMSGVDERAVNREYPRRFTRALGVPAIVGAVLYRDVDDARQYVLFNSALLTDREGNIQGRYDKTYLLAFGEYLPLGDTFPILYDWSPNTGKFAKGTSIASLQHGAHRLTVHICYEDVIPSFLNTMMRADPGELLVNITNDAWFGDSTEPWIHFALATFRAIEQRRYLVRSTNSGTSGFVDPVGRIVKHGGNFRQEALRETVAYMTGTTPYRFWGDLPWWLATAGALVISVRRRRA